MRFSGSVDLIRRWWARARIYREVMDSRHRLRSLVHAKNVGEWANEILAVMDKMDPLPDKMVWNFYRMEGLGCDGYESISIAAFQVLKRRGITVIPDDDAGDKVSA